MFAAQLCEPPLARKLARKVRGDVRKEEPLTQPVRVLGDENRGLLVGPRKALDLLSDPLPDVEQPVDASSSAGSAPVVGHTIASRRYRLAAGVQASSVTREDVDPEPPENVRTNPTPP